MQQYTIHPLVVGINETDQGVMTYLRDYGKRIYLPIYVFYLSGGEKNILVDSGLEQFVVPEGAEEQCGFKILEFCVGHWRADAVNDVETTKWRNTIDAIGPAHLFIVREFQV